MHRVVHVLDVLFTLVVEGGFDLAAHRALYRVGHRNATRFGQRFKPRRDIDAVAKHRAVGLFHYVAQMHADAKPHLAVFGNLRRTGVERPLNFLRRGYRAAGGFEHREHRVAGHVHDAALVRLYLGSEDRARGIQRGHGGMFVVLHQARKASRIGGQNGRQSLFDTGFFHGTRAPADGVSRKRAVGGRLLGRFGNTLS